MKLQLLKLGEYCSLSTSFFAAIHAWQDQADWALRIMASIVAISAGLLSAWFAWKRRHTPGA